MSVVSDDQPTHRYETVDLYRDGSAAKIVLNRPDRMNAWSNRLSDDLLTVLRDLAEDDSVRAVLLTGAGKAFCSGADLKEGACHPPLRILLESEAGVRVRQEKQRIGDGVEPQGGGPEGKRQQQVAILSFEGDP